RSPTTAREFRRSSSRRFSTRASPPRRRDWGLGWGCRSASGSFRITAAGSISTVRRVGGPRSPSSFPSIKSLRKGRRMPEERYRPTILIVDDGEMVTTSLRNLFRLQTAYKIVTYTSPEKALAESPQNIVDLVITDYLMPVIDGISFLTRFKDLQP